MDTQMGVIDLFSGCGGSAIGFKQAGFPIKTAVDIDVNASESFRANFPECKVFDTDISYISGSELLESSGLNKGENVILIACPPCQGFSSARRKSQRLSDPRNKLIFEFLRVVEEVKPLAFVMENVPGLATGIGKPLFLQVLQKLHELGYQTIYDVVNAADYGVPQKRKRLVLLGTNDPKLRISFPRISYRDPNKVSGLPVWKTVRNAISDLPELKAGELSEKDTMHRSANVSEKNLMRLKNTPSNGGSRTDWPNELVLECHKRNKGHKDVYGRMSWDEPSPTITGGCGMISKGRFGHPEQNRAISLREAARLQTFPDNYVFKGNFGQIASQIGNAVPPLLARKAAEVIIEAINVSRADITLVKNNFNFDYAY